MLPKDTLDAIQRLAIQAGPRLIQTPAEPPHVYFEVDADGSIARMEAAPPPPDHDPADIATVCELATANAAADGGPAKVWFSRSGVVATWGERSRAELALAPSPQLARLMDWDRAGHAQVKQAPLILLLRTLFADCYPAHPNLLDAVRKIDTKRGNEAASEVRQGKQSISRSMIAEMTGIDKLPEEITLSVPVFDRASVTFRKPVRVAVDPDPVNEVFVLIVLPGDVERAFASAETDIGAAVYAALGAESGVPAYYGRP